MSPQPMGQEPKEEGPAEEAPEEDTKPADLEPLAAYPDQNKRKLQIFEVDGYLRLRADYMHNFFLGEGYTAVSADPAGRRQRAVRPAALPRAARVRAARRRAAPAIMNSVREQPGQRRAPTRTSAAPTCACASSRR